MAVLFAQENFGGGLNTKLEASKLPAIEYPLLFNGRVTNNTIQPIKKHLKLDIPTGTNRQGLYAVGKLLVMFSDGLAYWKDTEDSSSLWQTLPLWTAMSSTAPRIYAEPIPVSYFLGSIDYSSSGDPAEPIITFPGIPAQTKSYLFVTEGETQPRVIAADQTWRVTGTYGSWTTTNPEYVPLCILPRKSGGKLYCVDPVSKNIIYHSVSGRFLDFGIIRDENGNISGPANEIAKAVDYNELTTLLSMSDPAVADGSVFAGTLFASYIITPDFTNKIFGEPKLPDRFLFPTGPVNDRSFADLNGDTAFITQTGIQSFNATEQFQTESNNFPLGAKIAKILVNPQTNTAATNFDTYALFSVATVYGKVVLVFDNILQAFVSIDLDFGEVVDFAVTKYNGVQKLFFLTAAGEVYQAYGDTSYATCRIYLGEYSTYDPETGAQTPGKQHLIEKLRLQFSEVKENTVVQVSVYVDRALHKTMSRTITAEPYPENIPYPLPFSPHRQAFPVDFTLLGKRRGWKTGVLLEWSTGAELLALACEGEIIEPDSLNITGTTESPLTTVTLFCDNTFGNELSPITGSWDLVTGLTIGAWYSVIGSCHTGAKVVTDGIFKAIATEVNVQGSLKACGDVKTIWDLMAADKPTHMIGIGDHAMDVGSQDQVTRLLSVMDITKIDWAPGNHDVVDTSGRWFFAAKPSLRYYKKTVGNIEFFLLNSIVSEPDGTDAASIQALWLKASLAASTATFKIICLHYPPYTDVVNYYPGYPTVRWPFLSWGADLVISGHSHVYERFVVDGLPYVVNGPSGSAPREFYPDQNNSVFRLSAAGYLRLTADQFKLLGEYIDSTAAVRDAFSINA